MRELKKMRIAFSGGTGLQLPADEVERFELEYSAWLNAGGAHGEFIYPRGSEHVCIRFDQIVMRVYTSEDRDTQKTTLLRPAGPSP